MHCEAFLHRPTETPKAVVSNQHIEKMCDNDETLTAWWRKEFEDLFKNFDFMVNHEEYGLAFSRKFEHVGTFAPIEFIAVACFIWNLRLERSDMQPDSAAVAQIERMREHLRDQHDALRINPDTWNTVWEFIQSLPKRASDSLQPAPTPTGPAPTTPSALSFDPLQLDYYDGRNSMDVSQDGEDDL